MRRHKLAFDPQLVVTGNLTSEYGFRAAKRLLGLPSPPSAITCVDDMTAMGVLHAAGEMGWIVGQNLAVTGFDGIEDFIHTQPPLTTIDQPVYNIACRLVKMLLDQIKGKVTNIQHVQIEPVLEIRQSSAGR